MRHLARGHLLCGEIKGRADGVAWEPFTVYLLTLFDF